MNAYTKRTMTDDDRRRFDGLILRHRGLIRGLCLRRSRGDYDYCADLIQKCYIHLWCYFYTLSPNALPIQQSVWVYWYCRSLFSHLDRKQDPLQLVPFSQVLDPTPLLSAVDPDDDTKARASQQRDLILSLAHDLTLRERQALDLMLEDYTPAEMAAQLNISQRSAITLRHRVISKLRRNYHAQNNPSGPNPNQQ